MIINVYMQKWLVWCKWVSKKGAGGMTIWPFIFYSMGKMEVSTRLREHEEFHWPHQLRWIVIPWFIAYWVIFIFTGYYDHPWERMAREAEK